MVSFLPRRSMRRPERRLPAICIGELRLTAEDVRTGRWSGLTKPRGLVRGHHQPRVLLRVEVVGQGHGGVGDGGAASEGWQEDHQRGQQLGEACLAVCQELPSSRGRHLPGS